MKRETVFTVFLALLTLGFFGCQKDDLSNSGPSTLGVKFETLNKSFSLPVNTSGTKSAPATAASITWDTVQLVVSNIKFEAELKSLVTHHDSIEISYKWTGPQVVNLLDSNLTLGNFILQPGFYDEIELKVQGLKQDASKNPVFYMYGDYTNNNNSVIPVAIKVYEDVLFKTEKDSVTVTEESVDISSYIQLYLDQLMADIDPSALDNAQLTDGVIVISADSNREIYLTIMRNLVKDHHCYYKHKDEKKKKKNKKHDD
jgi:hypothetical protein